ncbi:hypothetical protein Goklo_027659, partial [Gossypium klotzschianum]|nr:hypothetical protein [Gossypium klotzschianum]
RITEEQLNIFRVGPVVHTDPGCFLNLHTKLYFHDNKLKHRGITMLVIGFQKKNIKHIAQSSFDDYAKALSTGNIKAAFFWTPDDRFFLAKYCKSLGNPNCNEMLEAVLGFKQMKEEDLDMLSLSDCSSSTSDGTMKRGIGPGPFSGLFILSGSASTIALLITVFRLLRRGWERLVQGMLMDRGIWVWLSTLFCRSQRGNQLQLQLVRI